MKENRHRRRPGGGGREAGKGGGGGPDTRIAGRPGPGGSPGLARSESRILLSRDSSGGRAGGRVPRAGGRTARAGAGAARRMARGPPGARRIRVGWRRVHPLLMIRRAGGPGDSEPGPPVGPGPGELGPRGGGE